MKNEKKKVKVKDSKILKAICEEAGINYKKFKAHATQTN